MTMQNYITTHARRVTPRAFPSNPIPAPKLSLVQDAAQCNARLRQSMGLSDGIKGGDQQVRKEQTLIVFAQRDALVLDFLQQSPEPLTIRDVRQLAGMSWKIATQTLDRLREAGKAVAEQSGGNSPAQWRAVI
jgi:DNA-binding transcriptional ArsR family regulator